MLTKEINLNKKFLLLFILINIIALGLYYSYALFQVNVIKNNVIVMHTGTINLSVVTGETNNTFTVASGESKTITVNLSTTNAGEIGYKLYYTATPNTNLTVYSSVEFDNNIVEGKFTGNNQFTLTFKNTGASSTTITIGGIGGIPNYPIPLETNQSEIIAIAVKAVNVSYNKPNDVTCDDGSGTCNLQIMIDKIADLIK